MKVKVFTQEGKETGREIDLSDAVFGIEPNDHALWLAVRHYQAAQRQGTHKSKERWEINRTTKKAFRQKGTGGARRGDMKSPLVRGGGRVFGPKPHSYDFKLNKKAKDHARKSALAYKAKDGNIIVLESLALDSSKTKGFVSLLKNLNVTAEKTLVLVGQNNPNLILSARNIATTNLMEARNISTFDVMNARKIVLTEEAVKVIETSLS